MGRLAWQPIPVLQVVPVAATLVVDWNLRTDNAVDAALDARMAVALLGILRRVVVNGRKSERYSRGSCRHGHR